MNIILNWTNINTGSFSTKVYRGTAPLDRANLTNPLVTLTAGESTWTDTTAVRGTQYYYVLESTNANDKESTINIPVIALPRRGPGPVEVKVGDYNMGYFGTLTASEFITTSDLMAATGVTGTVLAPASSWQKFGRKGKVCYIPTLPLLSSVSWKQLYDLGMVFGVDGPGPYNAGADVPQSKKVVINGETFRVRLMTGFSDNYTEFPTITTSVAEPTETNLCEYNDFMYSLTYLTPEVQRTVNYLQYTPSQLGYASGIGNCLVQERFSVAANSQTIVRGQAVASAVRSTISYRFPGTITQASHWRPVLELVE